MKLNPNYYFKESGGIVVILALCALFSSPTSARENGAPPEACSLRIPHHGFQTSQTSRPPYDILINQSDDSDPNIGGSFEVILKSSGPLKRMRSFEGFLLQAVSANSGKPVPGGRFSASPLSKTLDCLSVADSVTHRDSDPPKVEITVGWIPPTGFVGKMKIVGTVVKEYDEFWTNLESAEFEIRSDVLYFGQQEFEVGSDVGQKFEVGSDVGQKFEVAVAQDRQDVHVHDDDSEGVHGVLDEFVERRVRGRKQDDDDNNRGSALNSASVSVLAIALGSEALRRMILV